MTFAAAVQYANGAPVILADVVAGKFLYHWTQDGTFTNCWGTPCTERVVGVNEDGTALTVRTSLTLCNSNAGSYYVDQAGTLYVNTVTLTPYDHTYSALVKFCWSNFARVVGGIPYQPRLAATPELFLSIPERFTQDITSRGGTLIAEQARGDLPTDSGEFDEVNLDWDAGYVTVRAGIDLFR